MFRKALMVGSFLMVMASQGRGAGTVDVKSWMTANDLIICDNEIPAFELSPEDRQKFREKYYKPLSFFVGANRVIQIGQPTTNVHWFIINQRVLLPQSPSDGYDDKIRTSLYGEMDRMLKGNHFKLAGLTTTGPYPTTDSPYTYFIVGLDLDTSIPADLSQVADIPKDSPPPITPDQPTPIPSELNQSVSVTPITPAVPSANQPDGGIRSADPVVQPIVVPPLPPPQIARHKAVPTKHAYTRRRWRRPSGDDMDEEQDQPEQVPAPPQYVIQGKPVPLQVSPPSLPPQEDEDRPRRHRRYRGAQSDVDTSDWTVY